MHGAGITCMGIPWVTRRLLYGVAVAAALIPSGAATQEPQTVAVGDLVRVELAGRSSRVVGTLVSLSADKLAVRGLHSTWPDTISVAIVRTLEVSRAGHAHTGQGAMLGALAGMSVGLLAVSLSDEEQGSDTCAQGAAWCLDVGFDSPGYAILGAGLLGAGIGALVGSAWRSQNWLPARLPRVTITPNTLVVRVPVR